MEDIILIVIGFLSATLWERYKYYEHTGEHLQDLKKDTPKVHSFTEEQLNERDNKMYREGRESVSVTDFNRE